MTTATKTPKSPTWDLESIFPGGSDSAKFANFQAKVKKELEETEKLFETLPSKLDDSTQAAWRDAILKLQVICEDIDLIISFSGCLTSQNVSDSKADSTTAAGYLYFSQWQKLLTKLEALSLAQNDEAWTKLVTLRELIEIRFYLDEMRQIAKSKMPVALESLSLDLAVNGYHAWNQLYDKMAGELSVEFESDGKTETLSLGQLATKMSDPNRDVRRQAFEKMSAAWKSRADLAAMALNYQAGFRLSLYKNRGWKTPQYEPLVNARMKQETLDTMWRVIRKETPRLKPYIEAKKMLLGIDKYCWYDEFSPVGSVDKQYSFDEAGQFVVDKAREFSPHMADFFKMALDNRWIEAEDRAGKRGGAFCTGTGASRESRVFMTYAGTYENLLTLAHELGHAYHSHVLKDSPYFATNYPMNLAETASIFAETLVTDAALKACDDPQEKLMLLEQAIQGTYVMFTDVHSRYIFDSAFYLEREKGMVDKDRLSEIMINSQKEAFGDLLDESGYHPLFWCSKLHFYITDAPFYNFPYVFGFLFSGGVYAQAKKEGTSFADKYRALLADTGSMTTEEVAMKHLGVDLTKEDFWIEAVNRSLADVDEFAGLAKELS